MPEQLSPAEVIRRLTDAFVDGDLDRALTYVSPNAVDHSPLDGTGPGLEGWRQKWEMLTAGVSDLQVDVEHSVEGGDSVARRLTTRGVRGGQPFEMAGMDMVRVRDGQVVEHWALANH
jgi:ketosteroid isomerase-like protein